MINTNGFITKYIESCSDKIKIEEELNDIDEKLKIPYEEIREIERKYGVDNLEKRRKDLLTDYRDNTNFRTYYWYRSIVDGVYNLLEEFSWSYSTRVLTFLTDKYHIHYEMDEGFRMFYLDSIQGTNPTTHLGKNIRSEDIFDIYYEDCDHNWFKIPSDVDIDNCLSDVRDLLKELTKKDLKKLEDEEYKTYLRLKEKYEGKDK